MGKAVNLKLTVKASFLVIILVFGNVSNAKVIYVDDSASGSNDGSSWTDSYVYLQDALAEAISGDEIRVAHGVYTPDSGGGNTPGDGTTTFQLKNGVEIKGGYVGLDMPEKADERSFNIFETILSRDPNGENDPNNPYSSFSGNSIVTGSYTNETAVLDGFTIIASDRSYNQGSLLVNVSGNPTIKNCNFSFKGTKIPFLEDYGFFNSNSNPIIINCIFELDPKFTFPQLSSFITMENRNSNPVLTECIFRNNQYCIDNRGSNVILKGCTFLNNSHTVINQDGGSLALDGCLFSDNSLETGSGVFATSCIVNTKGNVNIKNTSFTGNSFYSSDSYYNGSICIYNGSGGLTIDRCTFESNYSSQQIGLVLGDNLNIHDCTFINNSSNVISGYKLKLQNCRFSGNYNSEGSIISVSQSDIHNCIFEANTGIAININSGVYRELYNCTFYGNIGNSVIKNVSNSRTLNITNCIIRNNSSNTIEGNLINTTYCNIEGGWPGEGNIDIDPEFVRAGYWADVSNFDMVVNQDDPNAIWIMGDYHLKSLAGHWDSENEAWVKDDISSPCIDAGNINSPIGFEPFPNGGISNLGAYGRSSEASKTYFNNNNYDVILAGDINGDGIVDSNDQFIIDSQWLLEGNEFINQTPKVTFIKPQDGDQITLAAKFIFQAQVIDLDGEVERVDFELGHRTDTTYHGLSISGTKDGDIWSAEASTKYLNFESGTWTVTATATDNESGVTEEKITITLVAP